MHGETVAAGSRVQVARSAAVAALLIGAEMRAQGSLSLEEAARITANKMPGDWYKMVKSARDYYVRLTRTRLQSWSRTAPIYEHKERVGNRWTEVWYWADVEEPRRHFVE